MRRNRHEINELEYHSVLLRLVKMMQQVANHAVLPLHGKETRQDVLEDLMQGVLTMANAKSTAPRTTTTTHSIAAEDATRTLTTIALREALQKDVSRERRVRLLQAPSQWSAGSNKLQAFMRDLRQIMDASADNKIVVFSQFVQMLNLVEASIQQQLPELSGAVVRLDGQTSAENRAQRIDAFSHKSTTRIMLASLGAGGVGLNLQAANYVVLMDLWWNTALEQQALDRVNRFGQKRPVTMITYYSTGSMEDKVLAIQQRKKLIGHHALRDTTALHLDEDATMEMLNNKASLSTAELEKLLSL